MKTVGPAELTKLNQLRTIITGPGNYLTASGKVATIRRIRKSLPFPAEGRVDGRPERWHLSGQYRGMAESPLDIVAKADIHNTRLDEDEMKQAKEHILERLRNQ